MTATRRDEKIARLIAKGGLASYGLFWAVLEIVAEQMDGPDPACSVCYPVSVWSQLLLIRGSHVFSTLSTLAVTGVLTVERDGVDIRVTNRKLLKYRDEYSRKSGHSPDKRRTNSGPEGELEGEGEGDKKKNKKKTIARSVPAEELAGTLPLVDGSEYQISKTQVREWSESYPAVQVKQSLLQMKAWLKANPTRQKTPKGIERAIVSWLQRDQDSPRLHTSTGPSLPTQPTLDSMIYANKKVQ